MRAILLAVLALPLVAVPLAAAPQRIACEAPFGPDASHDDLVQAFGAANVTFEEEADGAEGEKVAATTIFPDDPDRRLQVIWHDGEARHGIANVTLYETREWVFGDGLQVGQTLAEIEAANDRPFDINGFGWDYGGAVVDWKGGKLGAQPGGCLLGVFFSADEGADPAAQDAVSGDQVFTSDDPKMKAVRPTVYSIYFGYAE